MRRGVWIASWLLFCLLAYHPAAQCLAEDDAASEGKARATEDEPPIGRYRRLSVMGPVTAAEAAARLPPPSDGEIIRAYTKEARRDPAFASDREIRIVKKLRREYTDPERFIPLIGMCTLHHACYQCTIYSSPKGSGSEAAANIDFEHELQVSMDCKYLVRRAYVDHNHFRFSDRPNAG